MSNPTIETTVLPLNENTNDNATPAAPVDSTAAAPRASRVKSPAESCQLPAAKPHCRHRVRTGAYCRLPVSDPKTGLCFRHASLRLQEVDSGDLSEELVCGIKEFHSAVDINHVLGELYKLLAANKISPRRGAVMAYTCSLLLRTLPAIDDELQPEEQQIIFDLPRPKRDWPEGTDPAIAAHENWASYVAANPSTANLEPASHTGARRSEKTKWSPLLANPA